MRLPLLREEWDFEAFTKELWCDDPNQETDPHRKLYECFTYEYARSLPHVLAAFQEDKRLGHRIVDGVWRCSLVLPEMPVAALENSDSSEEPWDELDYFPGLEPVRIIAQEGFPEIPYLKLNHLDQCKPAWFQMPGREESVVPVRKNRGIYFGDNGHAYQHSWVATLYVNWHHSNDAIVNSFRAWMLKARATEESSIQGKSIRRQIEANLKALGAWRLMKAFDGNIQKASEYSKNISRKSLFVRSEDWKLMSSRAERILKDFSLREIRG